MFNYMTDLSDAEIDESVTEEFVITGKRKKRMVHHCIISYGFSFEVRGRVV